jgi:hypothetical protein
MIKSRRIGWAWYAAHLGEKRNAYRILMGKSEGTITLEIPRRRWEDNFKMDLREIEWGGMDWLPPTQNGDQWRALLNTIMNLRVKPRPPCM